MGREVGGRFRMGDTCTPMGVASFIQESYFEIHPCICMVLLLSKIPLDRYATLKKLFQISFLFKIYFLEV